MASEKVIQKLQEEFQPNFSKAHFPEWLMKRLHNGGTVSLWIITGLSCAEEVHIQHSKSTSVKVNAGDIAS